MEPFYIAVFGVLAALAAVLELTKGKSTSSDNTSKEFSRFRTNYVLVYSLMMGAFHYCKRHQIYEVTSAVQDYQTNKYCGCGRTPSKSGRLRGRTGPILPPSHDTLQLLNKQGHDLIMSPLKSMWVKLLKSIDRKADEHSP